MTDTSSTLPKGITLPAKVWATYISKNVKCRSADNPDAIFLLGRTVLDKETFNKLNDTEHDVVHGVQVVYGPFSTKAAACEFVSEYDLEWPGENEWRWIKPGQPEIISSFYEPGKAEIVNNASLEFQGQLLYQEQQRKIREIEDVQERIHKREEAAINGKVVPTQKEIEQYIQWQEIKISQTEKALEQMRTHLEKFRKLKQ